MKRTNTCKFFFKNQYFTIILTVILAVLLVTATAFITGCKKTTTETHNILEENAESTLQAVKDFKTSDQLTTFGNADIKSDEMQKLKKELDEIVKTGKFVSFVVINTKNQSGFSYQADREAPGKSTIKAPYITSLLLNDSSIFQENKETIKKIITISDNDAYAEMRTKYGNNIFADFMKDAGVDTAKAQEKFPLNMTTRDMVKMWCKMYPMLMGNLGKAGDKGDYAGYFKCTAYSPFSTLLWRNNNVLSKAGWDEGIRIGEDGIYEKVMAENFRDGDPKNNEEAMNDTGIVSSQSEGDYGDYIFAYFTDFPAISDIMYPLIQAIHNAAVSLG